MTKWFNFFFFQGIFSGRDIELGGESEKLCDEGHKRNEISRR